MKTNLKCTCGEFLVVEKEKLEGVVDGKKRTKTVTRLICPRCKKVYGEK